MPYFGQEIFEHVGEEGTAHERRRTARRSRSAATLSRTKGLDADVREAPARRASSRRRRAPPALIDLVNGDPGGGSSTSPCAVAGYPAITVPMGYACGLPLGITFMGLAWSEATLLKLAYAFEQATKVRKAPRFCGRALNCCECGELVSWSSR